MTVNTECNGKIGRLRVATLSEELDFIRDRTKLA